MALEETRTGSKANLLPYTPSGCVPEGDRTAVGKYTAKSSVLNATLVISLLI